MANVGIRLLKRRMLGWAGLSLLPLLFVTRTMGQEPESPPPPPLAQSYASAWEVIDNKPQLSSFRDLVLRVNDVDFWHNSTKDFTAFIPTNQALQPFLDARLNSTGPADYPDAWRLFTRYHQSPSLGNPNLLSFFLSISRYDNITMQASTTQPPLKEPVITYNRATNKTSIMGASGTPATLGEVVNVTSDNCVYFIDNVLQYWYSSVFDAFADKFIKVVKFRDALASSTDLSNILSVQAQATPPPLAILFVPSEQAMMAVGAPSDATLKNHLVPDDSVARRGLSLVTAQSGASLSVNSMRNAFNRYQPTGVSVVSQAGPVVASVGSELGHVGFGPAVYLYSINKVLQDPSLFPVSPAPSPSPSPNPNSGPRPGGSSSAAPCLWLTLALATLAVRLLA